MPETPGPRPICSRCNLVVVDGPAFVLSVERSPADGHRFDPARLCQGCAGQLVNWLKSDTLRFTREFESLPRREPAGARAERRTTKGGLMR